MHDMLPRKPTTAVADLKKSFMKDSMYSNGMNPPSGLLSPAHSGGSSSPAQEDANCLQTSNVATTTNHPLPSPSPMNRKPAKSSPKQRRSQNPDSRLRNSVETNFCANNNNSLKQQRRTTDERSNRTPSRNSVSDDLSSSSLTPTTDEQTTNSANQNSELHSIFDDEMFDKVLSNMEERPILFPETNESLKEFDAVITSLSQFDASRSPLKSLDLDGELLDPMSPMISKPAATASPTRSFDTKSSAGGQSRKSHLQDILGVTDTQRLENMSRPIDSVSYKSPTTTTSYNTGVKPTINQPCTMAPPTRHNPGIVSPSYKPNSFQFANEVFPRNAQHGFMENTAGWNRGSPRNVTNLKSPTLHSNQSNRSPASNVNPMSGLQNTVDSIPAAPSEPGTPTQFMGPPNVATPSPGSVRMRPPPSPSLDKRCTSADSVVVGNGGKKAANKRERTKSADSKDDDRKDTAAPKSKRRKSRSKDEKSRGASKEERFPRALTSLLDPPTNNPYMYIFSTEEANRASALFNDSKVPSIILYHQSYLGNRKLPPSGQYSPPTSTVKSETPDTQTMSMPTTCRSPTELSAEKPETNLTTKSPATNEPAPKSINLQETKPPSSDALPVSCTVTSESHIQMQPHNGAQDKISHEKMQDRQRKLLKMENMRHILFQGDSPGSQMQGLRPPGWPHHQPYRYPAPPQPGMKDVQDQAMGHRGPENAEWLHLVQEHHADKMRRQEAGIPGDLPSRPPPPYPPSQRYPAPDGFIQDPRMPMDHQRMARMRHRIVRMPQESRVPPGYMPHRMVMPRGHYPNQPQGQQPRLYDPYGGPNSIRHPRLSHHGMRSSGENYPFSEQLMKQASYYNSVPPYDPESGSQDWGGTDGSRRLSHMPGTSSPVVGPQVMDPRIGVRPNYEQLGHYHGDMRGPHYEMLPPQMGSPTGGMEVRGRAGAGVGSMMDAIARRGGQRPPDLNLANQMPPRSPMNYPGHMASPSMNVGPRFSNPGELGHPQPQPSPMHSRSPSAGISQQHMGMEQPMMMGPHSAGPITNPPTNEWSQPGTPNSGVMHRVMTSQPGMMSSQANIMQQPPHSSMMSQPSMLTSQSGQIMQRKPGPSTLSIMMDRMNMFKMPEKSPLYHDAVKDTASPPPLTHQSEPPPLSHNPMPANMRMVGPPTYEPRLPHPRLGPHEHYPHPQGYPSMINMPPESLPQPSDYPQGQRGFSEVTEFDLRNILPSERPSQTIAYMPSESNQFSAPEWAGGNDRPHLIPGPPHPRMGMP